MAQKGTAPSFFQNEADRGKPGPVSPISAKGYRHLEADDKERGRGADEAGNPHEDNPGYEPSRRKIRMALDHAAAVSKRCALARQALRSEPGAPMCWREGSDAMLAYYSLVQHAAQFVEKMWPGTRLWVPLREEDEPQKTLIHARNADNNRKRSEEARERHREIARSVRAIRRRKGLGTDAAIEAYRDRLARMNAENVPSAPTCYRALAAVPEGEDEMSEGRDDGPPAA